MNELWRAKEKLKIIDEKDVICCDDMLRIMDILKEIIRYLEKHAPNEVGGTDEGSKGSGDGLSKAVNEPES